jgi:2-polyprenyl-3-methyl-5-hydroxy-6-metoxy-1,4-benzoquinol methylase
MVPFLQRSLVPELMDQPGLAAEEHRRALRALARINAFSRAASIVWPVLRRMAVEQQRPLRILDVASGGGDIPIRLWRMARRAGYEFEILGIDVSPFAVSYARERASVWGAGVEFRQLDVVRSELPELFDVAMSSLFLHHLSEAAAVTVLSRMAAAARRLVLISDLQRCRAGHVLARAASRVLTRSHVVRVDGPRSVAAAFTVGEMAEMFDRAGLPHPRIRRCWPLRLLAEWEHE